MRVKGYADELAAWFRQHANREKALPALREYSKTDEAAVRRFVAENSLSPLSEREALKYVSRRNDTTYS